MGRSIFDLIKENKKKKIANNTENENIENNNVEEEKTNFINKICDFTSELISLKQPQVYSMAKENNIARKIDENLILTRDNNLAVGFEIQGLSYSAYDIEQRATQFQTIKNFLASFNDQIEVNIIAIKKQISQNVPTPSSNNQYIDDIIKRWNEEKKYDNYEIKYYIIASTISKAITGGLEKFKDYFTTEKEENKKLSKEEKESKAQQALLQKEFQKQRLIRNFSAQVFNSLGAFVPKVLSSDELINFYASYANAKEVNLLYTNDLITDCYLSSMVEFKKDYIVFERNDNQKVYGRFVSIKAYETDFISSSITNNLLHSTNELIIFMHCKNYGKAKALKKIKDTRAFLPDNIKIELDELRQEIEADRETLMEMSFSVYFEALSLEKLNEKTNEISYIINNQGVMTTKESLNQKPLFFSFFASRGNLNARKRTLKLSNIATLIPFNKEVSGFDSNDWGEGAITHFKHLNNTQFNFNFHWNADKKPAGHTMIFGATGAGKTMMSQFLMLNLFKYNIDIFAMDKLNGMRCFTNYCGGEYYDSNEPNFKLNPFSLPTSIDDSENINFLKNWLLIMGNFKDDNIEAKNNISATLERLFRTKKEGQIITLSDFVEGLDKEYRGNFRDYQNSLFDNADDALNFEKKLSVLGMDSILKDPKLSALSAMYIFHKLTNRAKKANKNGFFCFIDELKDYIKIDEKEPMFSMMNKEILRMILEARKIGGVMLMGFQNLSIFKNISNGTDFLANTANFIIFPTTNEANLNDIAEAIGLTGTEREFLIQTPINTRQFLLKMQLRNETCFLNGNLGRLGNYLRVFSSNADDVRIMEELKKEFPDTWREKFIYYKKEKQ